MHLEEVVPSPPTVLPDGISLAEAWHDLQNITAAFHPFISHENDRVRKYFIDRVKQILDRNEVHYTVETLRVAAAKTSPAYIEAK